MTLIVDLLISLKETRKGNAQEPSKTNDLVIFFIFLCFIIFCRSHGKFCFNKVVSMRDFLLLLM